ncbi:MAG: molybdenum cofactor guanylyltransferase [Phycicoccus sp.]
MISRRAAHHSSDVTVVVLAGGGSRRFGSDKLVAPLRGSTVLDVLLTALPPALPVVAVGPRRRTTRAVRWTREQPPGGGPLAGVEAGLRCVSTAVVALVAGDLPDAARALPALLNAWAAAPPGIAGVVAIDAGGVPDVLLSVWSTEPLRTGMPASAGGRAARELLRLPHLRFPVEPDAARDIDTPDDLRQLGSTEE